MTKIPSRNLAPWLWLLLVLFGFRVTAQLIQWKFSLDFLPSFSNWQSGALPYTVLLISQILILLVMFRICYSFSRGHPTPNRKLGMTLLAIGIIYFIVMFARLLIGIFVLPDHFWFGRHLPTVFHLALASFILLIGYYHFSQAGRQD